MLDWSDYATSLLLSEVSYIDNGLYIEDDYFMSSLIKKNDTLEEEDSDFNYDSLFVCPKVFQNNTIHSKSDEASSLSSSANKNIKIKASLTALTNFVVVRALVARL